MRAATVAGDGVAFLWAHGLVMGRMAYLEQHWIYVVKIKAPENACWQQSKC
jgi:hypothetical protein